MNRRNVVLVSLNLFCTATRSEHGNKSLATWQENKKKAQEIGVVAKGVKDQRC